MIGLSTRYDLTGDLVDLEATINVFQQAVQATPSNSPERPGHLVLVVNTLPFATGIRR